MTEHTRQARRQVFLTQEFFTCSSTQIEESIALWLNALPQGESLESRKASAASLVASDTYELLSLRYTAGVPLAQLRSELTGVIEAYERYQGALEAYEQTPQVAPLGMGRIDDYERCMQLIGLCYLLHRRDLLPRIAALQDPAYAGGDALYEDLLCYALPGRFQTDELLHLETYDPLLGAMYNDSDEGAAHDLQEFVANWYKAFEVAPWHDSHTRIEGAEGDYFGYWAFEAGAVALLCSLDDRRIDHMVYPKHLVAWARENAHLSASDGTPVGTLSLRCDAGQPCPQAGYWSTPAQAGSRKRFEAGAVMPAIASDYGTTIWQWDLNPA
jgi:hypothetical protein